MLIIMVLFIAYGGAVYKVGWYTGGRHDESIEVQQATLSRRIMNGVMVQV